MSSKRAPAPGRADGVRIAGRILGLIFILELALDVRRERKMLLRMDDRALKDIGLSRCDAWAEGCRSLWEIPRERLWP
jgi:uncharacterized protein YjiS (DUF1127 family)